MTSTHWNSWIPFRNKKMKVSPILNSRKERWVQMAFLKSLCKIRGDQTIEPMTMVKMLLWGLLVIFLISNLNLQLQTKTLLMKGPLVSRIKIMLISTKGTLKTWACWRIWPRTRMMCPRRQISSRRNRCASRLPRKMRFRRSQLTLTTTCLLRRTKECLSVKICSSLLLPITVGTISTHRAVGGKSRAAKSMRESTHRWKRGHLIIRIPLNRRRSQRSYSLELKSLWDLSFKLNSHKFITGWNKQMMGLDSEIYIYSTININIVNLLSLKHLFIFIIIVLILIVPLSPSECGYEQLIRGVVHVIPLVVVLAHCIVIHHHPVP